MDQEPNDKLRDLTIKMGKEMADKIFAKRGNHSEAHLGRDELAVYLAVAIELGYEMPLVTE